jgi:putative transposase
MVSFKDEHRKVYGVGPMFAVLPIAPSTYYEQKARQADLTPVPKRIHRDRQLEVEIRRVWKENFCVYGARKVWRQLNREGISNSR